MDSVGSAREWTEEAIIQWTRTELGELREGDNILLKLELSNDSIKEKLADSIATYNEKIPALRSVTKSVSSGNTSLELTDIPGIRSVIDVEHEQLNTDTDKGRFRSLGIPYDIGRSDLDYQVYRRNYHHMQEYAYDSVFAWDYDDVSGILSMANVPGWAKVVTIQYTVNHDLSSIPEGDRQDIRKLTAALSKKVLGRVRSKYSSDFPGAGGSFRLNGPEMLQEGTEEQQRIEESWDSRLSYLWPTRGYS